MVFRAAEIELDFVKPLVPPWCLCRASPAHKRLLFGHVPTLSLKLLKQEMAGWNVRRILLIPGGPDIAGKSAAHLSPGRPGQSVESLGGIRLDWDSSCLLVSDQVVLPVTTICSMYSILPRRGEGDQIRRQQSA